MNEQLIKTLEKLNSRICVLEGHSRSNSVSGKFIGVVDADYDVAADRIVTEIKTWYRLFGDLGFDPGDDLELISNGFDVGDFHLNDVVNIIVSCKSQYSCEAKPLRERVVKRVMDYENSLSPYCRGLMMGNIYSAFEVAYRP
jgi:hypothetical protein